MAKEQMLVNGKPMTQEQYTEMLKTVREATKIYKETPQYKQELEAKKKLTEKKNELINKFIALGEKLGLTRIETGKIGYAVYLASKKEE